MLKWVRHTKDDRGDWRPRRRPTPDQKRANRERFAHPRVSRWAVAQVGLQVAVTIVVIGVHWAIAAGLAEVLEPDLATTIPSRGYMIASVIAVIAVMLPMPAMWCILATMLIRRISGRRVDMGCELCPACSYTLADTAPDREGFTICPECGGAWRVPAPWHTLPLPKWWRPTLDARGRWRRPRDLAPPQPVHSELPKWWVFVWGPVFVVPPLAAAWLDSAPAFLAAVGLDWILVLVLQELSRRRRARRLHRCFFCDHDLSTTPPESDGCTVCPECGAASA